MDPKQVSLIAPGNSSRARRGGDRPRTSLSLWVPYRRSVDLEEFIRRVKIYLDLDFPGLADAEGVAAALGVRLFQYVRQPLPEAYRDSRTLQSLLQDEPALLFFTADWDGSAPGYRAVVGRVGEALGLRVVDVDIDDPVGSALARLQRLMNTPCVIGTWNPDLCVVGERAEEELTELFGRRHRPSGRGSASGAEPSICTPRQEFELFARWCADQSNCRAHLVMETTAGEGASGWLVRRSETCPTT
jgi:hypothetical protein